MNFIENEELGFVNEPLVLVLCVGIDEPVVDGVGVRKEDVYAVFQDVVPGQSEEVQRYVVRFVVLTLSFLRNELEPGTGVSDADTTTAVLTLVKIGIVPWTLEVLERGIEVPFRTRLAHVAGRIPVVDTD